MSHFQTSGGRKRVETMAMGFPHTTTSRTQPARESESHSPFLFLDIVGTLLCGDTIFFSDHNPAYYK